MMKLANVFDSMAPLEFLATMSGLLVIVFVGLAAIEYVSRKQAKKRYGGK